MLSGDHKHGIDAKNRLFIPAKYRDELGESFIISKSIRSKCLRIYSMPQWEKYIEPILKLDGKENEKIIRWLSRNALQVSCDTQGRIVLTPELIRHAEIEKNTHIIGCHNYAEIWSDVNYEAMLAAEDLGEFCDLLESYGL